MLTRMKDKAIEQCKGKKLFTLSEKEKIEICEGVFKAIEDMPSNCEKVEETLRKIRGYSD